MPKVLKNRLLSCVLIAMVLLTLSSPLAGLLVRHELERRLEIKIRGSFIPVLFRPVFYLRDARFQLEEKVELVSGTLQVEYFLHSLLHDRLLRVRLVSQNVQAKLLGEWSQIEGVSEVVLDRFIADLGLGTDGIKEIYEVDAHSSVFQFRIKKSET